MPASHSIETTIENSPASSTITFPGNLGVAGTFAATGATTLSSTVSTGALTAASAVITAGATIGTTLGVTGAATLANLIYPATVARTATADGLTTGTIADTGMLQLVTVTSANADHIIVLPTPTPGTIVILRNGATGYELRTSTTASISINGGTGSAGESAIAASTMVIAVCTSATTWQAISLAGTTLAAVEAAAN